MDGRNQKLALKVVAPWGHTWVGSGTTANTSWVEKDRNRQTISKPVNHETGTAITRATTPNMY
jgi:hypothetical protein